MDTKVNGNATPLSDEVLAALNLLPNDSSVEAPTPPADGQADQEKPADLPKQVKLTLEMPEELIGDHWECYTEGSQEYMNERRSQGRVPNAMMANFNGAVALLRAGYLTVKVESEDPASAERISTLIRLVKLKQFDPREVPINLINRIAADVDTRFIVALMLPLT